MPQALGKGFAECNTRQKAHCIYSVGKQLFAECFLSRTRQIVCRVSNLTLSKKKVVCRVFFQNTFGKGLLFAECFLELHSANLFFKKKISAYHYCLPSVLGNYTRQTYFPKKNIFFLSISVHLLHNSRENLILSKLEKKYLTSCLEK